MTAATQRTPGPWIQRGESVVTNRPMLCAYNETSVFSFKRPFAERLANAAFIVRACNAHDELVAALRDVMGTNAPTCWAAELGIEEYERRIAIVNRARAALAKVAP
jgi:hypothetical protein